MQYPTKIHYDTITKLYYTTTRRHYTILPYAWYAVPSARRDNCKARRKRLARGPCARWDGCTEIRSPIWQSGRLSGQKQKVSLLSDRIIKREGKRPHLKNRAPIGIAAKYHVRWRISVSRTKNPAQRDIIVGSLSVGQLFIKQGGWGIILAELPLPGGTTNR